MEIGRDAWIHGNTCGDMYSWVAMCGDVEMYVWMVRKCVRCVEVVLVCVERCVWRWLKMSGDVYRFVEITTPYISTHLKNPHNSPLNSTHLLPFLPISTQLNTSPHFQLPPLTSTHIFAHISTHFLTTATPAPYHTSDTSPHHHHISPHICTHFQPSPHMSSSPHQLYTLPYISTYHP